MLSLVRRLSQSVWKGENAAGQGGVVLQVDGVTKLFHSRGRRAAVVRATDGVSISAGVSTTVGVVGESGCGKTPLGRMVAGLVQPTEGTVRVWRRVVGEFVDPAVERGLVQMIYQDPTESLDPRLRVDVSVSEPLLSVPRSERAARVEQALESVGIANLARRYPHELSGGQQQRACIARAMVAEPSVVVLDEAVSALDVLLQVEVLALLQSIQADTRATFLFISHDLAAVRVVADYILVMYLGRIMEVIPREEYATDPLHPYTVALQSAELSQGNLTQGRRIILKGDPPSNTQKYPGCRFASRCPAVMTKCLVAEPDLVVVGGGRSVACYYPGILSDSPSSQGVDISSADGLGLSTDG